MISHAIQTLMMDIELETRKILSIIEQKVFFQRRSVNVCFSHLLHFVPQYWYTTFSVGPQGFSSKNRHFDMLNSNDLVKILLKIDQN